MRAGEAEAEAANRAAVYLAVRAIARCAVVVPRGPAVLAAVVAWSQAAAVAVAAVGASPEAGAVDHAPAAVVVAEITPAVELPGPAAVVDAADAAVNIR